MPRFWKHAAIISAWTVVILALGSRVALRRHSICLQEHAAAIPGDLEVLRFREVSVVAGNGERVLLPLATVRK